eukprot:TRINITY_DN16586_c0_g1_i1.p1 TRINITY_DN16586_c0_g1~~TRINITY_DN16586_c0_g1_i1.p1  ORF type:complete len:640 (+),score=222.65 TRINITY_DN16586_c0_g1_i1:126-1922(+)
MKERVRRRKSITEKSTCKGGRVRNIDIKEMVWDVSEAKLEEWRMEVSKKRVGKVLACLVMLQIALVAVQCAGVLGNSSFLVADGSNKTLPYHLIVATISLTVLTQVFFTHRYFTIELAMLPMTNPLWGQTTLLDSPILTQYILEMAIFSFHEPPGLVLAWPDSYKLGMLCVFKAYIFWRALADMSYTTQQGGKLVSAIARIRITWTYQLRAAAYTHPWVFQIAVSVTCLLVLSACNIIANNTVVSISDAVWGTFATMTSGDPRITEPDNWLAKLIAGGTTIVGLALVSLLISQISRSMELTMKQKRVLLFMSQAQRHQKIEELAARILCRGFINVRLVKEGQPAGVIAKGRSALSSLCEEFRNVRRGFNSSVADFHALWPDNLPVATKLREIESLVVHMFDDRYGAKRRTALLRALSNSQCAEEGPFQSRRETTRFIQRTKRSSGLVKEDSATPPATPPRRDTSPPPHDATVNGKVLSMLEDIIRGQRELQAQCSQCAEEGPFQSRRETTRFIQRTKRSSGLVKEDSATPPATPPRRDTSPPPHDATVNGKVLSMLEDIIRGQRELQAQCATLSRDVKLLKLAVQMPSPPMYPVPDPP